MRRYGAKVGDIVKPNFKLDVNVPKGTHVRIIRTKKDSSSMYPVVVRLEGDLNGKEYSYAWSELDLVEAAVDDYDLY